MSALAGQLRVVVWASSPARRLPRCCATPRRRRRRRCTPRFHAAAPRSSRSAPQPPPPIKTNKAAGGRLVAVPGAVNNALPPPPSVHHLHHHHRRRRRRRRRRRPPGRCSAGRNSPARLAGNCTGTEDARSAVMAAMMSRVLRPLVNYEPRRRAALRVMSNHRLSCLDHGHRLAAAPAAGPGAGSCRGVEVAAGLAWKAEDRGGP